MYIILVKGEFKKKWKKRISIEDCRYTDFVPVCLFISNKHKKRS